MITVQPLGRPISGRVRVPGSKSFTNRAIILAICSDGATVIENPLLSDDTHYGIEAAKALGCTVHTTVDRISIEGIGRRRAVSSGVLTVGSAGTIARFLPCALAFGDPGEWTLAASEQMSKRPMSGLLNALAQLGNSVDCFENPERYPLRVRGGAIENYETQVDGSISSQYLSGLLLAAPQLRQRLRITTGGDTVQSEYVAITVDCMRLFGAEVKASADWSELEVFPSDYTGTTIDVEADASTASYFAALPAALGGTVELPNLNRVSHQPDTHFVEILQRFGCDIRWSGDRGVRIARPDRLTALRGGHRLDLNECSDVALTTAAVSVYADEPVEIVGVEHIRHHECDRISTMTAALTAMGVHVEERRDGWKIWPSTPHYAAVSTGDDHRVAMALSVTALGGGGVSLDHPDCVNKTCPTFFDILSELGATATPEISA